MKIGHIVQPNKKGQIVIPQKVREVLNIDEASSLNIIVRDGALHVYPITNVGARTEYEKNAYIHTLKKTQGAWGTMSSDEKKREIKQRKIELAASEK